MTSPGAFADLAGAARLLASGGVRGRAGRPAAAHRPAGRATRALARRGRGSPGPTWTCACTGARRCRSAGSAATSWSAPTTAGGTGPTAAARPSRSWPTRPGCPPRHGSPRSAASSGTGWSGWPWTSPAGRCPRCRNWRTASGRCSPPGPTGGPATRAGRWRTSPTWGISRGCTRGCWATRTGRWCRATRCAPRGTCCTTRSPGRRRRTARTSRCSATSRPGRPTGRSRYELHLPYTIALRLGWGGERGMVYFFAAQPADGGHCAGYVVIGRNYNLGQPDRVLQDFEDTIFGQDQVVVESQRPGTGAVRPGRGTAPQVRRGGRRLPEGHARLRPGPVARVRRPGPARRPGRCPPGSRSPPRRRRS